MLDLHESCAGESAYRLPHSRDAHIVRFEQLSFGRQLVAEGELSAENPLAKIVENLLRDVAALRASR